MPTEERPLNGTRVTVKDNYHLSGIVTTVGSRSFEDLYGAQISTSVLVRRLIDTGGIMIW